MRWLRARLGMLAGERGSALVEFVFIAIVVFVPLVYVVAGFSAVQRGVFASTAAAREAGRAMGTAPDPVTGAARAEAAARLAARSGASALPGALLSGDELRRFADRVSVGGPVGRLLDAAAPGRTARTLLWLAKHGLIEVRPPRTME